MSAQENSTTDVAAMFRDMPVPSMLSLMLSMNGLRNAGQQELFETKDFLYPLHGQTGFSKRDIFNKFAPPMMRMPVEDYFLLHFTGAVESTKQLSLFNNDELPAQAALTLTKTEKLRTEVVLKGQQELFPLSTRDMILKTLMPDWEPTRFPKINIMTGNLGMGRKEYVDYLVLQFTNSADKQMPLFSEEQLPSATSLTNFLGAPKGFCSSGQETAVKQKNPSRQP